MYTASSYRPTVGFGRPWTPAVRAIILACGGVYLAQLLLADRLLQELFALDTARPFEAWRWVSYIFLHGGVVHLLFNLFAIWMFGSDLEERLGTGRFVAYFLFTGAGAALSVVLVDRFLGRETFVVGASGAVFGLLLAYGVLFAERVITMLVFFVLPVSLKAKHFVLIFGVVELLFGMSGGDRVSHVAHLGGMLFGLLYLKSPVGSALARRPGLFRGLRARLEAAGRARDDRRMDELLAKVNERGIGSLSEREKSFLHRMSRRKRWQ
jgi:membrane associated rhomboid family serine protease